MRFIIIILSFMTICFSQSNNKIALDPNATGENFSNLDKATEKSLRDAIENGLVNLRAGRKQLKVFTVAVRGEDLKKQLDEQNFQLTSGCTPRECAAEIGKILNIDYMLLPRIINNESQSVSSSGRWFSTSNIEPPAKVTLSLRLINVQTGEVVSAVPEQTIPLCSTQYRNNLIDSMVAGLYNNSDQSSGIKKTRAIRIKKLQPPLCAKNVLDVELAEESGSSNNLLLVIGGILLLALLAGASGGDSGGNTGGVDIGITIP
mgnify:CR=1 FL=1